MKRFSALLFLPRFGGRRASFKIGIIATLAIAVGANIAVLGNLGVIFGNPIPGATHQNLYEPYFKPLKLKSEPAQAFGMFRPVYDRLSTLLHGHADIALYQLGGGILGKGPRKQLLYYLYATPSLANVLGVQVIAGRSLRPSDAGSGAAPVIVVSASLARRRFGSYGAAVGHRLSISGKTYRIVGVLPPALQFPSRRLFHHGYVPRAWIPFPPEAPSAVTQMNRRMHAIVRPHPGFSVGALKAAFVEAYQQALPRYTAGPRSYMKQIDLVQRVSLLAARQYGPVLTRLKLLELAALLLLVLVFINLAGLATSDAIARRHELAARAALGASGRRLFFERFRLLFGLCFIGWLIGIGLGWLGQRALAGAIGQAGSAVALSAPVLLITLGFVLVIAILLATIGLRRVGKPRHLLTDLASGGHTTGSRRMVRVMRSLIALQLAASVVLLVLAGNFYVNVFGLIHNNLGFTPAHRSFFTAMIPGANAAQRKIFTQKLLARLNQRADIEGASRISVVPFSGDNSNTSAWIGNRKADHISINEQAVSKRFVQTMGLKVLAGNPDAIFSGSSHDVFVDATTAQKLWPNVKPSDVVGRSFYLGLDDNGPYRIVAVVAPLRMKSYGSVGGTFFISYKFVTVYGASFVVHSPLPPGVLHKEIAGTVHAANPRALLLAFNPVESVVGAAYAGRTQLGRVFGVLAVVALLIAAVGLFALLAYRSLVRRPEFAIRGALGATPGRLLRKVLGEAGALWIVGCLIGVPAAYGLSIVLAAYLPKLGLPAAWVAAAVVVSLGLTAVFAALVPARRAAGTVLSGNLSA